jgi:Fic family protein
MAWNWQQPDWPHFTYDAAALKAAEDAFLNASGLLMGAFMHIPEGDQPIFFSNSIIK